MPFFTAISLCLFALVGLALIERFLRDRAWKAVPIRIHVNGTRGKSSVTRLIWGALRQAGIPVLAKTTGAAPRLLFPDGTERPVGRRGKPNIREQLRTLWLAKRTGTKAVVLECMALAPELQWISEHSMVRATIGVITNARVDHAEVMGHTWEDIAGCLSNTIPCGGVLVVGDARLAKFYGSCAAKRQSKLVAADNQPPAGDSWHAENRAVALAVTRQLGIADEVALAGMDSAPADPGDSRLADAQCGNHTLSCVDARSANDPESFLRTVDYFRSDLGTASPSAKPPVLIYNHRADRPHRLHAFANVFHLLRPAQVLITGDRPAWSTWRSLRHAPNIPPLCFTPVRRLPAVLTELAGQCGGFVFCGNTHGLDLSAILNMHAHG